jgi:hypothetical protein
MIKLTVILLKAGQTDGGAAWLRSAIVRVGRGRGRGRARWQTHHRAPLSSRQATRVLLPGWRAPPHDVVDAAATWAQLSRPAERRMPQG